MAGGSTEWRGRSVISKVVALLDAFTPASPELSLNELAALTGLPVSTTYRLASELVAWGGLERVEGGGLPDRPAAVGDRVAGPARRDAA